MRVSLKLLFYFTLLATSVENAQRNKKFLFLQTQVQYNTVYIQKHDLTIMKNRTALRIELNVAQDYPRDAWVQIEVAVRESKAQQYRVLFNYDLNVCRILGKQTQDNLNLVHAWIGNFWKYGNLPKSCPILKGNYFWRELRVDKFSLPGFLLNGKYRAYIHTYFHAENRMPLLSLANVTVFALIK